MPTVFRKHGLRGKIYTNDHLPPHVHVEDNEGEVKIAIGNENIKPSVIEVYKMKRKNVLRALILVGQHQEELLERWEEIHG